MLLENFTERDGTRMKKRKNMGEIRTDRWKKGGIIAALVAAVAVFAVMLQLEKSMLTKYERGQIYVAVKEIPKGQLITEENRMLYFEERLLDKTCIPESALCRPEQVNELAAVFDIAPGVLLTGEMFESMDEALGEMENPVIAGFKADDLYQVVGGVLRAGDRIHIYKITDSKEADSKADEGDDVNVGAVLIWENIYVQEVFDQTGKRIVNGDEATAAQRINIYLDKEDVEAFYAELASGTLRVVKDCR